MRLLPFVMLVGCYSHANCGENAGSAYARFIDPEISCWSVHQGQTPSDDFAICHPRPYSKDGEAWLCSGEDGGWCKPLGPRIQMQRVR